MLESLIQEIGKRLEEGLCVELSDGRVLGSGNCKVKIKDKNVILNILKDPEMGFGEAYMKGAIEIDGDIERFLIACLNYLEENEQEKNFRNSFFRNILKYTGLLKFTEEKEVRSHYDLGNDFYKLWLDDSMTYSCAFFTDAHQSLEMAQKEKGRLYMKNCNLPMGINCWI